MTQASLSESARARSGRVDHLDRLEDGMARLERELQEAMENENSPLPQSRRNRHRALVKLSVITGGIALFLTGAAYLPPANPVTQAVDYTVSSLVRQMPSEIADPPDLGSMVIGNPDYRHQPLRPVAMIKAVLPISSSEPDSAGAGAVAASAAPAGTAPAGQPGGTSVMIPVVKGEKVAPTSAPAAAGPVPTPGIAPPPAPAPVAVPPPAPAPPPTATGSGSQVVDPPSPPIVTPAATSAAAPVTTPLPAEVPTPTPPPLPTAIPTPSLNPLPSPSP